MRISIFGLGYVGAVSLACLVRDGHDVIGVDIDETKLDLIRHGKTPVIEAGMDELMRAAAASERVAVTTDAVHALRNSDLALVCVGTPSLPNGSQDLHAILRLAEQLGDALRLVEHYPVIIIRSTVIPGTVEGVIKPLLEQRSGKRVGRDFGLGFQPEFLREGSSVKDYDHPPFTIIGADSERSLALVRQVFAYLPCEFIATSIDTAEMLKYCCNAFHALKVTFANEIGRICQAAGVDAHEVMDLVCRDVRLNISKAYLKPGFAFGGSCLPKDLRALVRIARDHDVQIPMLGNVLASNHVHIDHAIAAALAGGRRSIAMLGLSFKTGTDDLRESPLVTLAEQFIGKGLKLRIYDPLVNVARLVGANRRYIEESIPHISSLMAADCVQAIDGADVIIVGLNDAAVLEHLYEQGRRDQTVLDLVNIPDKSRLACEYHGICW